jgi:hypothetical protein
MLRTLTATAAIALALTGCSAPVARDLTGDGLNVTAVHQAGDTRTPRAERKLVVPDDTALDFGRGSVTSFVPVVPAIEEDDPRFDCATMGNGICGPVAVTPAPAADWSADTAADGPAEVTPSPVAEEPERSDVRPEPAPDAGLTEYEQCMAMLAAKHPDAPGTCGELDGAPASDMDPDNDGFWAPVTTFDEATAQCDAAYPVGTQANEDCISAAIVEWCEFVPFTPENPHYDEAIDGRCLNQQDQQ